MVFTTLLWSLGGPLTRMLHEAKGLEVTFWRSVFAALTVGTWFAFRFAFQTLKRDKQVRPAPWWPQGGAQWLGGLLWAVMFTCFTVSMSLTPVANVLITQSLTPIFTALLAWRWLHKPVTRATWAAVLVAALGICTMYIFDVSGLSGPQILGVVVALGIPSAGALNWILLQRVGSQQDMTPAVWVGSCVSAGIALPFIWPLNVSAHDLTLLALLGVVQLGIPCILAVQVTQRLMAAEVSLLALLEVVFGILLSALLTGERPGAATLWGGTAVLVALAYNEWASASSRGPGRASASRS
jgi:drug/metabolite transporter (DMT)-like permease